MTTPRKKNTFGGLEYYETQITTICLHYEKHFGVLFEKKNT